MSTQLIVVALVMFLWALLARECFVSNKKYKGPVLKLGSLVPSWGKTFFRYLGGILLSWIPRWIKNFFRYIGKSIKVFALGASLASLIGIVFVMSPDGYAHAVDWRDHRVTISIARNSQIEDIANRLDREDFRQINCLARNMYFEAGNQGQVGMAAVGDVVFNRLQHGIYPDRICQVIDSGKRDLLGRLKNGCEFSWRCDGLKHDVRDNTVYAAAYEVAYNQYLYRAKIPDLTGGARFYHADYVDPHNGIWKKACPVKKIGAHIFYTLTCGKKLSLNGNPGRKG